jgi:hypothetical protein
MGRVGTDVTVVFSGWGPSGRRFKSGLPDQRKAPSGAASNLRGESSFDLLFGGQTRSVSTSMRPDFAASASAP